MIGEASTGIRPKGWLHGTSPSICRTCLRGRHPHTADPGPHGDVVRGGRIADHRHLRRADGGGDVHGVRLVSWHPHLHRTGLTLTLRTLDGALRKWSTVAPASVTTEASAIVNRSPLTAPAPVVTDMRPANPRTTTAPALVVISVAVALGARI